jgi:hypothetical protein
LIVGVLIVFAVTSWTVFARQTPQGPGGLTSQGSAAIIGTVTTEAGQPLARVTVRAFERVVIRGTPESRYFGRASTRTGARGEYRIDRLPAGSYIVDVPVTQVTVPASVAGLAAGGGVLFQRITDSLVRPPYPGGERIGELLFQSMGAVSPIPLAKPPDAGGVYVRPSLIFPGTASTRDAQVITLVGSDEFRADMTVPAVLGRRVSGLLRGPAGEVAHLGVRLLPVLNDLELFRDGDFEIASTVTDAQGAFTFLGVPPGQYTLKVLYVPTVLPSSDAGARGAPPARVGVRGGGSPTGPMMDFVRWAEANVTVGESDLAGLDVPLHPPVSVTGRVALGANMTSVDLSRARIAFLSNRPVTIAPPAPVPLGADGRFAVRLYGPGRYSSGVSGLSGLVTREISIGGAVVPDRQLQVPESGLADVTVTMINQFAGRSRGAPPPVSAPNRNTPPPPNPDNGFIAGRVIDGATGEAVRNATVNLQRSGVTDGRSVTTDETGSFSFGEATPGTYGVTTTAVGYAPGAFGRLREMGDSSSLGLPARASARTLEIRMWKLGQLGGRVTDEAGKPIANAVVSSFFVSERGSMRTYGFRSVGVTDPTGQYRISDLSPGEYVICMSFTATTIPDAVEAAIRADLLGRSDLAARLAESLAPRPGPAGTKVGSERFSMLGVRSGLMPLPGSIAAAGDIRSYRTTCHGGAAWVTDASVVAVHAGETRERVDLRVPAAQTAGIAGIVRGPGGPTAYLGLRLLPVPAPGEVMLTERMPVAAAVSDAAGAFTFLGVPPGRYMLRAFTSRSGDTAPAPIGPNGRTRPAGVALWADVPVTVPAAGLTAVAVTLQPTARISGRVVFDGDGPPPSLAQAPFGLAARQQLDPPVPDPTRVNADGTFTLKAYAPGPYRLPTVTVGSWRMVSATIGGKPVKDHTIDLGTTDITDVVLTMTNRFTELSGRIAGPPGLRPIEATIFIFPADYREWIAADMPAARSRSFRATGTWTFRASWLPPGDYLAIVYPEFDAEELTPAFVERLAKLAVPVTFSAAEKKTMDLTVARIR